MKQKEQKKRSFKESYIHFNLRVSHETTSFHWIIINECWAGCF